MKNVLWLAIVASLTAPSLSSAELVREKIEYTHDGQLLEGYRVHDNAVEGRRPGVLVVHEYRGLNDYARGRADQLAGLGYVAFAADMYGKGVYAESHEEASKLAGAMRSDRTRMRGRILAALEVLKAHPLTDPGRIGAIGYCFGGTTVLELARSGADVKGVASFHGALSTPDTKDAAKIKGKVLVLHGANDRFISAEEIAAFQNEMREAGVDWQMIFFGGAVHSFTVPEAGGDPSKGVAYHADADRRSWQAMKGFFEEIFR